MKKIALTLLILVGTIFGAENILYIKNDSELDTRLKDKQYRSVVVDFYADWCAPCKRLTPVLEKLANDHTDILFVKVNVDAHKNLAQRFNAQSIPTIIAFKNGTEKERIVGFNKNKLTVTLNNL